MTETKKPSDEIPLFPIESSGKDDIKPPKDLGSGLTPQDHWKAFQEERMQLTAEMHPVLLVLNDKALAQAGLPNGGADGAQPPQVAEPVKPLEAPKLPEAPKAADVPTPAVKPLELGPKLEGDEAARAKEVQQNLIGLTPLFATEERLGNKAEIERIQKGLAAEQAAGVFGPASKDAFSKYLVWMKRSTLSTIRELDMMQLELPPGCPVKLPTDTFGGGLQRAIDPQFFKALAADDKVKFDWNVDANKVPSEADLNKLDIGFEWLTISNTRVKEAVTQFQVKELSRQIEEMHFPEGCKLKPTDDPRAWIQSGLQIIDASARTKNMIEAMHHCYKGSRNNDFPFVLPEGASVTVEHNGKTRVITDKEVNDWDAKQALKDGKLIEVKLDLPKDFRQEDPHNRQRLDNMLTWMDKNGDTINHTLMGLLRIQEDPDAIVMYGDVEMKNCAGRFDKDNKLLGLCDPRRYQAKPGETLKHVNLIGYNYYVNKTGDGENAKYEIRQTMQGEDAPPWAYLNARILTTEVGQSKDIILKKRLDASTEVPYGPDDFVPVRNGDKIELIKAKNLDSYKRLSQVCYYGEKGLIAVMDAAMFVTGTIEVGMAIKGARLAIPMANAALKLTAKEAVWAGTKGTVRVGVAGLGVFNNAGARETEWGEQVNLWRGRYFLADVSQGLARGGFGLVRKGIGLGKAAEVGQALGSTEKIHSLIHGTKAITAGDVALKGTPYVAPLHTASSLGFRVTEYGFVPFLSTDVKHQWDRTMHPGKRDPLKDALIVIGDGRGGMLIKRGEFDAKNKEALEASGKILDNNAAALKDGRSPETQRRIDEIMAKTKELMKPDANPQEKEALKKLLIQSATFNADEIIALEKAHPSSGNKSFALAEQQLKDYLDPAKLKDLPKSLRTEVEKILAAKDKDVVAASRIALFYLCRDADGKFGTQLGAAAVEVPSYKRRVFGAQGSNHETDIAARTANISLTPAEAVIHLKREISSNEIGNRGIPLGDTLVRVGAITHEEYGALLQDVLRNPNATRADKMRALTDSNGARLGTIIDALRYKETLDGKESETERNSRAGRAFGLTSADLIKQLEETAAKDSNADVKAMAAATLFCLRERDVEVRAKFMNAFNQTWQELGGTDGAFSAKVVAFLEKEMNTGLPKDAEPAALDKVREIRINGAIALAHITDVNNKEAQKKINEALATSMSTTSPLLTLKVMQALLPERINQLTIDNPNLSNAARATAVELIGKPKSDADEAHILGVMERIEPFLKNGEGPLKVETTTRLQAMLRNNRTNKEYAEFFPALREGAIKTLGDFGDRSSLDIIRSHMAESAKFKIGDTEIVANESEPSVRAAAVLALTRLADPALRQIVNQMIDTENDANVANKLRDVRFKTDRIEPSSAEYKDLYEKTATDVIGWGKKYPYLEGFGGDAPKAWIQEKFPLLKDETWKAEAKSKIDNATGFVWRNSPFTSAAEINSEELKAGQAVANRRSLQFRQLCEMARKGDEDGNKAKMALFYIMTHDGQPCGSGSGLEAGAIDGYWDSTHKHKYYQSDWKDAAARELFYLAEQGCEGRDVTAHCIKQGLVASQQLPGYVSFTLLHAWGKLGTPNKDGHAIPVHELARVTAEALRADINRRESQTEYYQDELIKELNRYGHRKIFPVLEAIKDHSKFEGTKKAATQMLSDYRDSVKMMWDNTQPDQSSSGTARADRLKAALDDKNNSEKTVQEIFNAYKGYVIFDGKDAGLAHLQLAMNETNQRTAMAAAKILMESQLPNDHPAKVKAIATLSHIAVKGSAPRYKTDASAELMRLDLTKPIVVQGPNGKYQLSKQPGAGLAVTELK